MRLIDADAAKSVISKHENRMAKQHIMILEIEMLPTIESRPHGHWIGKPIAGYSTVRCSVCGTVFRENTGKWKSCPECTAIMDEEASKNGL